MGNRAAVQVPALPLTATIPSSSICCRLTAAYADADTDSRMGGLQALWWEQVVLNLPTSKGKKALGRFDGSEART